MKAKLKNLLVATVVLAILGVYFGSDYIWAARIKAKAPSTWVLVYESKSRSILPWTWFYPASDGLWFITMPPTKLDQKTTNGENLILTEVVAFYKGEDPQRSEYFEVISPDRKASHILSTEQYDHILAGHPDQIQFDWKTYEGDNAGTAIVRYCAEHATEEAGEFAPHFSGKGFSYIGDFFHNYAYIRTDEDGNIGGALADNHFIADVWTAREAVMVLFQDPKTRNFALLDPSDPETIKLKATDLKLQPAPAESTLSKAWLRATKPTDFAKDRKKGRLQDWVFVDLSAEVRQVERFYVGTEINTERSSGLRFVPVLIVTEERFTVYLDPKGKKFAPVATDLLGTPLDEMKYRDITPGGLGEAVLKLVTAQQPK